MDSRQPVARVREFNRFFTHQIGLLNEGLLDSPYSLTEVRVLFELRQTGDSDATHLANTLGLDAGYLSRILRRFVADGLIERDRDDRDARRRILRLTARGQMVFDELDQRSSAQIADLLAELGPQGRGEVLSAMSTIQDRLTRAVPSYRLREPRTGDLGRIVTRHAELYAEEHGWNRQYEALVATIMADFGASGPSAKARLWVADSGGDMVGSIMCVPDDEPDVAKLRVLLVEPHMRGHGVGGALIERCLSFATEAGYRRIRLWTVNRLTQAARLYRRFGFEMESESLTSMFGDELVAQTWGRDL